MKFQYLGRDIDKEVAKARINPYRTWWILVLLLPLIAYFFDKRLLTISLGILAAFPLVEVMASYIDKYEGKFGKQSLFHVGIYLDRMNAFPIFVLKIVGLSLIGNWLSDIFILYVNEYQTGFLGAYLVLVAVFLYYRAVNKPK